MLLLLPVLGTDPLIVDWTAAFQAGVRSGTQFARTDCSDVGRTAADRARAGCGGVTPRNGLLVVAHSFQDLGDAESPRDALGRPSGVSL